MSELLPCPFCGSEPVMKHIGNDYTKSRAVEVKCSNAYCRVARTDKALRHDHAWLTNVATENWNRRPAATQAPSAPVAPIDVRAQFEAWCDEYGFNRQHEEDRNGIHYATNTTRAYWVGWSARAALSVKAGSYPEILEDWEAQCEQLRAQYPGIDGEFKVFDVMITTELDCKLEEGEYGVDICELVNGYVGEHDFGRIEDAVSEVIDTLNLPGEGQTIIRVYESGEREDVFWNSYWRVAAPTPPTTGEA